MKNIILRCSIILFITTILLGCTKDSTNSFDSGNGNIGTGGSTARFIIVNNYLYVVDQNQLTTFYLDNNGTQPEMVNTQRIGFNIETIFNMGDNLLIGSQSAMYIYSIRVPNTPEYVSSAQHLRACDPVVANEKTAYVTVRSSATNPNACGGNIDALLVYDITNIGNPILQATHTMQNPHGLALQDQTLYVTEGSFGLKVFKINGQMPQELHLATTIMVEDNSFLDCIVKDGYLYAMMLNGFIIYDISNPLAPVETGRLLH